MRRWAEGEHASVSRLARFRARKASSRCRRTLQLSGYERAGGGEALVNVRCVGNANHRLEERASRRGCRGDDHVKQRAILRLMYTVGANGVTFLCSTVRLVRLKRA
jgi:hypothetical protein